MNKTYKFGLKGDQRKALVSAMQQLLQVKMEYLGAPTFAYQLGDYHIDREGTVTGPENLNLMVGLLERGFEPEADPSFHLITPRGTLLCQRRYDTAAEAEADGYGEYFHHEGREVYVKPAPDGKTEHSKWFAVVGAPFEEAAEEEPADRHYRAELGDPDWPDRMEVFTAANDEEAIKEAHAYAVDGVTLLELHELDDNYDVIRSVDLVPTRVTIEYPLGDGFDLAAVDNLKKMVAAKEGLIKMALDVETLPIEVLEDCVAFPWFRFPGDINAYSQFIAALAKTAMEKTRVNAQPKEDYPNPRFTMRCWLISLGLTGPEFKLIRKLLTASLPGNGAWSTGIDPRKAARVKTTEEAEVNDG